MLNDCDDPEVKSQLLSDFKENSELMRKLLGEQDETPLQIQASIDTASSNSPEQPTIKGQSGQTQSLPSR